MQQGEPVSHTKVEPNVWDQMWDRPMSNQPDTHTDRVRQDSTTTGKRDVCSETMAGGLASSDTCTEVPHMRVRAALSW
jgi:hypothetical protein